MKDVDLFSLKKSALFSGMSGEEIEGILPCLHTRIKNYNKREIVIQEGDTVNAVGIVLSGRGRSMKDGLNGNTVIVSLLESGSLVGVLLASSQNRRSPVSVQALENFTVLFIPIERILHRCVKLCAKHDRLLCNVLDCIAEKALILHDRNDCLIKPTVRDKILTYLRRIQNEENNSNIEIPFDRSAMAEYLNVERSALSRELARMKSDGLIDYHKNRFAIYKI